jgi:hypothetical protein
VEFWPLKGPFSILSSSGRLIVGLAPMRLEFDPRPIQVGYIVNKVALRQVFQSTSVLICQNHFIGAPYSYLGHLPSTSYNLRN